MIRALAWLLTLVVALWLISCRAAALISPVRHPLLAFLPFTTALAFLANGFMIVLWLFRKRWLRITLPVIAIIGAWSALNPVFGFRMKQDIARLGQEDQLRVLLWNVHGLGIYDLPEDKRVPGRMLDFIKSQDPDIVCLVEFYTDYNDAMKPHSARFMKEGGFREFRFVWDNTLGSKIFVGIGLFSKLKVSAIEERWIAKNINMLQADVQLPSKRMIRVATLHLESFHLADDDKAAIEEAKTGEHGFGYTLKMGRAFVRKSVRPFQKRAVQADSVRAILNQSPYPLIVCGDMNDLPGSYAYTRVRGALGDAFAEHGRGFGRTYNRLSPTLRIDNIFFDPKFFRCVSFKTAPTVLSDHNPVIATFAIQPQSADP